MKKIFYAIAPVLLLSACTGSTTNITNSPTPSYADTTNQTQSSLTAAPNEILVTGPLTLSRNSLFPYTQKQEYLSVVLTNGEYFEDWVPGPFMGRNWAGEFQIQLSNENGEVKDSIDLNDYFNDEIVFNSLFDIDFDDYNGDGNIDFTIGQYASSNGSIFKLFTLDKSGRIEVLPIKENHELFISGTGRYSTELVKEKSGFSTTYYDNSIGRDVIQFFEWTGTEFVSGPIIDSEYKVSNLEFSVPKGWMHSGSYITDENGIQVGHIVAHPYTDDLDFKFYKPNHSIMTNEELIDTPIGSGTLYTLDADNGTAASGITGTHDVYFAVIPIQDEVVYVLEFSRHDKEAASKIQFVDLLNGLQIVWR